MSLSAHARRRVEQQSTELLERAVPNLRPLVRRTLTALLARTAEGWHLFVRGTLPAAGDTRADAFLVGKRGVFAVVVTEDPPDETTLRAIARHAEESCGGMRVTRGRLLAHSAIHHVVITPSGRSPSPDHTAHWSLAEHELPRLFQHHPVQMTSAQGQAVADQLATRLRGFRRLNVDAPARDNDTSGLFDGATLTADHLAAAQEGTFASWMTFLHPHQNAVVTRDYSGPARISGPAGTGKTVVALHRLRHLARRSAGPLLFTTFVRTLPLVHRNTFRQLAPEVADRVEFTNLHAWIRRFLTERRRDVNVSHSQIGTAFSLAWMAHRAHLQDLEPAPLYWQAEIDRVIKGRGIRTLREYQRVARRGRSVRLDARQREQVWALYEAYQHNLAERGLHDYNDMINVALEELTARPLEERFAAVVVDEVQDITLAGLRLLREMAGDGPNRLLLIGDGQQQVYPGGWRLSDAGIPVQGRGEILRVNYRNRANVLSFAQHLDATNHVDDLDGAAGVTLRNADSVNAGGDVHQWQGTAAELETALPAAINGLPVPLGQTALIVFQHRDLDRCADILRQAGVPLLYLDQYQGETDDKLKIGTVHRAKGLDFQAVIAVRFTNGATVDTASDQEAHDLRNRQHLVAATRARDYLWWGTVDANRT